MGQFNRFSEHTGKHLRVIYPCLPHQEEPGILSTTQCPCLCASPARSTSAATPPLSGPSYGEPWPTTEPVGLRHRPLLPGHRHPLSGSNPHGYQALPATRNPSALPSTYCRTISIRPKKPPVHCPRPSHRRSPDSVPCATLALSKTFRPPVSRARVSLASYLAPPSGLQDQTYCAGLYDPGASITDVTARFCAKSDPLGTRRSRVIALPHHSCHREREASNTSVAVAC